MILKGPRGGRHVPVLLPPVVGSWGCVFKEAFGETLEVLF